MDDVGAPASRRRQRVRDTATGEVADWVVIDRWSLKVGQRLQGPAIIAEDETSTLVGPRWSGRITELGYIELVREHS